MTKIFITGGAGYVGSALVPKLLEAGHSVVVYDLYLYGDVFSGIKQKNLTEIRGDIRDRKKLIESAKGCDSLIHLACVSNDPSFELDPTLGKSINYDAFFNVIDAAKENDIGRFIYASSASTYGIQEGEVTEERVGRPITDYGKYKLECEKVLEGTNLNYVTVRPGTVCGYATRLRLDLTVNLLTMHALVNKKITIFGGSQLRPHINIRDMVRIYETLLAAPQEKIHREVFNTGFWNISVLDTGKLIKDVLNDPAVSIKVSASIVDNRSYKLNADKIERVLGFKAQFDIPEAVRSIKAAYERGDITDGLNNPLYHNVKMMQKLGLT